MLQTHPLWSAIDLANHAVLSLHRGDVSASIPQSACICNHLSQPDYLLGIGSLHLPIFTRIWCLDGSLDVQGLSRLDVSCSACASPRIARSEGISCTSQISLHVYYEPPKVYAFWRLGTRSHFKVMTLPSRRASIRTALSSDFPVLSTTFIEF
jgi:hypothetical protein